MAYISVMHLIPAIEEEKMSEWTKRKIHSPTVKLTTVENYLIDEAFHQELCRRLDKATTNEEKIAVIEAITKEKASAKRKLTKERKHAKSIGLK
jgi:hypothetical protein